MTDARDVLPQTVALLDQGIADGLHRGAQLYVSRHGQALVDAAFGESRLGVAMQPDTLTLWLSAGKPVTAVAIARLHEQGRLRFDDPVCQHLPEFATGGKEAITIAHLLTHTGGFRTADRIPENLGWDETLRRICETPLEEDWIPGWQAGYHRSASWLVLSEILRRITGNTIDRYTRENIFLPLTMNDSWLGLPREEYERYGERVGLLYLMQHRHPKPHPLWNSPAGATACRPGSNVRGPIRELGRFYEWLLAARTGRPAVAGILKPENIQFVTTRRTRGLYDQTIHSPVDWGMGFYLHAHQAGDEPVPYGYGQHASPDTFGHSGAQSSCAFADPHDDLAVAWLCNGLPGEPRHQQRAWAINTAIYDDLKLR